MAGITEGKVREIVREEVDKVLAIDIHKIAKEIFKLQKGQTNREGGHQQK